MGALLYRQNQSWRTWAALGGAVLVHLCAVALATNQLPPPPVPLIESEIVVEVIPPSDDPQPPLAQQDPLPPPASPVTEETFIAEENPTPPPVRKRHERWAQPIIRPAAMRPAASASLSSIKVSALMAPRPEYPYEARRQRLTGSGVALLSINSDTGSVVEVSMLRSTGSTVLDQATISGFRRWRFKPGTVSRVQSPITYTLTGASY